MNCIKELYEIAKEDIENYKLEREHNKKYIYSSNKNYSGSDLYRLVQEETKMLRNETKYYQQEYKKMYWENDKLKKELEYYKSHQKIEIIDLGSDKE